MILLHISYYGILQLFLLHLESLSSLFDDCMFLEIVIFNIFFEFICTDFIPT